MQVTDFFLLFVLIFKGQGIFGGFGVHLPSLHPPNPGSGMNGKVKSKCNAFQIVLTVLTWFTIRFSAVINGHCYNPDAEACPEMFDKIGPGSALELDKIRTQTRLPYGTVALLDSGWGGIGWVV